MSPNLPLPGQIVGGYVQGQRFYAPRNAMQTRGVLYAKLSTASFTYICASDSKALQTAEIIVSCEKYARIIDIKIINV